MPHACDILKLYQRDTYIERFEVCERFGEFLVSFNQAILVLEAFDGQSCSPYQVDIWLVQGMKGNPEKDIRLLFIVINKIIFILCL